VGAALDEVGVGVRAGARVGLGLRLRVLVAAGHGGRQPHGGRWVGAAVKAPPGLL